MNEEKLKKFYENGAKHFNLPDFETFKTDMQDDAKLERYITSMSKHYNVASKDVVKEDLFGDTEVIEEVKVEEVEKPSPVVETAPAAGEEVAVTDSVSVDGGLDSQFLKSSNIGKGLQGRSGLPSMTQAEADKLKKDYPKEKKKQEDKKLLESLEYIAVPGKDYEVKFDAPSQDILGGMPTGVDYLDSQYDKIVKGDYRGHYENGEFVLAPDFTLEDWFETDEGKAWWEKNWNAPRNNYVMEKAEVYEAAGARPGASALEQIDYGIGRGLNYLGLGFNNETPEEQVFKAVNEDGAKEDQQFMPFINAGIQRGSEVNNIEALNIEIGNLLSQKDINPSSIINPETGQVDLNDLPEGIIDEAKMNVALKNAESLSTYQHPTIAKVGFHQREIIRLSTNNPVTNPLGLGNDINNEINKATIAEHNNQINILKKDYFKNVQTKDGGLPNQWYDPLSGTMVKKSEATSTQLQNESENIASATAVWGDTNIETLYQRENDLTNELIYLAKSASADIENVEESYGVLLQAENFNLLAKQKEKLQEQANSKTLIPGLSYIQGNTLVASKFNAKLNEVLQIQKAIDLNFKPTDIKNTANFWDYLGSAAKGKIFTSTVDSEGSDDADIAATNEALNFINFTSATVGEEKTKELKEYWEPGMNKSSAHAVVDGALIAAEFIATRGVLGKSPARIKEAVGGVTKMIAGEGRVATSIGSLIGGITEEAYVIQAYNSAIATPLNRERFDLKFAIGAGGASWLAAGSKNLLMGSQTYRNTITTINKSKLGSNLLNGTVQPVLGTFTVMSGQIVENAMKEDVTLGEAFKEATDFENMLNTLIMVTASKAANPVSAINRVYEAGMNDFRAIQGTISTKANSAAKILDLQQELKGTEEQVIEVEFQGGTEGDATKTIKKKSLTSKQVNNKASSLRAKEGLNKPDSQLTEKQIARKNQIKQAARDLNDQLLYTEANQIFKAQYGKNDYANVYTMGQMLLQGKDPNAAQKLTLANMSSMNQAYSIIRDPNGPFAKNKQFETNFVKFANQYKTFVDGIRRVGGVANDVKKQKQLIKQFDVYLETIVKPLATAEALKKQGDKSIELKDKIKDLQAKEQEWRDGIQLDLQEYTSGRRKSIRDKFIKPLISKQSKIDYKVSTTEEFAKEFPGEEFTEGLFVSEDGRIRVNEDYAKEINSVTVDAHEVLHPVMDVTLDKLAKQGKLKPFIDQFKESLPKNIRDAVQEKIDSRSDITDKDYTREWFTITSDVLAGGKIKIDNPRSTGQKLAKAFTDLFKSETPIKDVDFETGNQAFEFIKRYAESVRTGKTDKSLEEAVVSKLERFETGEGTQRSMTEKEINKFTKTPEGKNMNQIEWFDFTGKMNDKGELVNQEKIGKAFEGMINSKIKGDKNQPGWIFGTKTKKDVIDDFKFRLRKKGFYDRKIEEFNPEVNDNFSGYMAGLINYVYKDVLAANTKSIKTISTDRTIGGEEGKTTLGETFASEDLDPSELADKAMEEERRAKLEAAKPKKTIAEKVGMPKVIKQNIGGEVIEKNADKYVEEITEGINYDKIPNINEPPGPNQTISPFLSKLGAQIATSKTIKADVSQSMGKGKQRAEYLTNNFKNIVENLSPSYFSGLIERAVNSGKEPLLPKGLVQKDVGQGYTSNWYGKKAVGVKSAKTGITSNLKRIRINPNFDFKSKSNIEAFQKAFKSQGRYEGLASQLAAKSVIKYVEKSLGSGNKLDTKIKQQYGVDTKGLVKEFKLQLAKANYQRSSTEREFIKAAKEVLGTDIKLERARELYNEYDLDPEKFRKDRPDFAEILDVGAVNYLNRFQEKVKNTNFISSAKKAIASPEFISQGAKKLGIKNSEYKKVWQEIIDSPTLTFIEEGKTKFRPDQLKEFQAEMKSFSNFLGKEFIDKMSKTQVEQFIGQAERVGGKGTEYDIFPDKASWAKMAQSLKSIEKNPNLSERSKKLAKSIDFSKLKAQNVQGEYSKLIKAFNESTKRQDKLISLEDKIDFIKRKFPEARENFEKFQDLISSLKSDYLQSKIKSKDINKIKSGLKYLYNLNKGNTNMVKGMRGNVYNEYFYLTEGSQGMDFDNPIYKQQYNEQLKSLKEQFPSGIVPRPTSKDPKRTVSVEQRATELAKEFSKMKGEHFSPSAGESWREIENIVTGKIGLEKTLKEKLNNVQGLLPKGFLNIVDKAFGTTSPYGERRFALKELKSVLENVYNRKGETLWDRLVTEGREEILSDPDMKEFTNKKLENPSIGDYALDYMFNPTEANKILLKTAQENIKQNNAVHKNNVEVNKEASLSKQYSKTNKEILDGLNTRDKAFRIANNPKAEIKKARVFDFDDTIARTKSKVFATKEGKKKTLTAEEFAKQGEKLEAEGWKMDFSDFNKVVDGKKGPLFEVMKKMKEASGQRDMFVLTARSQESAKAIKRFLKEMGIDIPLKNIKGLGNSSPYAKSDWIVGKAAEGYNDFYFADDAIQNVKAVRDALEVLDVKSKTQQAKIQRSETLSADFNKILEESTGVGREKIFSDVKAELRGAKARRQRFFIPPSAEDFMGLLYPTLGKGKQGEAHLKFYKESLFDPYSRAMENLSTDRVNLMADFKELKKQLDVPKDLRKETESGFTNEQAVRTYLWAKTGREIPGLSKSDFKELNDIVEGDAKLKAFAEQILSITKGDGYSKPGKNWAAGTITTDLMELLNTTKRSKYLETWQQNADLIFSKDNMNKLEAVFGKKYRESLESALSRMKAGRNRIEGGNRLSNGVLDYINNSTGVVMFLNMRSAVLQTISAANFVNWSFNNPLKAGKAFANQPQYWADFKELMNSDYLKDRRNGLKLNINESEIANAAKTSKNKAKAVISYIIEKGYTPTKFADSFAIATGGATFYRNRINDLMKNEGKTEVEAKKQAMEEFRKVSELSQQSSDPSKISKQQSGDLGRMILQYVNTPMQYARLQKRDIQDIANKRRIEGKTLAQSNRTRLSRIAYYGFIQNLMFNALQQGLFALGMGDGEIDPDEEKTLFKSANGMLDSSLRGLGLAGVTVQVLKNLVMDVYDRSQRDRPEYVDAWQKLLDFSPAIKSKMSKFKGAAYPFDSKKRRAEVFDKGFSLDNPAYESLAKVIAATTNIPLDRLYTKTENVKHAFDENNEAWQSVAMILGWPSWQVQDSGNSNNKSTYVGGKSSRGKRSNRSKRSRRR